MKTIVLLSQKGGTGKSTIATHLAVCAMRQGRSVTLLDLDPQGSSHKWSKRRKGDEPEVIHAGAVNAGTLLAKAQRDQLDLAIIDTAGRADPSYLHILHHADMVLIPCRPSAADLDAIEDTISLCKLAIKANAAVILNAASAQGDLHEQAMDAIKARIQVCPVVLRNRIAYSKAWIDGRSVEEYDRSGKAAEEIRGLYRWIANH